MIDTFHVIRNNFIIIIIILFIMVFRTIRHRLLDVSRHRRHTRGHDYDTAIRMVVTIRFQHEGKPFRRCADTGTINFASY